MASDADAGFPASEFWDFTIAHYGRAGLSPAVIALQDRLGVDVNMLLLCCWAGSTGRGALGAVDIVSALAVARPWQSAVVEPLRAARRHLKPPPAAAPEAPAEALRRRILGCEIDGEHVAQLMMEATVTRAPDAGRAAGDRLADTAAGLGQYFAALGAAVGDADRADLAALLGAVFEDAGADAVTAALAVSPDFSP